MNYDLVGIGNALVDIEIQVDDAFIEQASVTKGGMTLSSIEDQKKIDNTLLANLKFKKHLLYLSSLFPHHKMEF